MTRRPDRRGPRSEARERALGLLYEAELRGVAPAAVLDEAESDVGVDPYAAALVVGVGDHQVETDALLRRFSHRWDLDRMPVLDRAVLRLGVEELARHADVPTAVVLDEAVELAKRYSTDDSGRFVNGMLASIAEELRGDPAP